LRQSFLDGSLTRLLDADATLRAKIAEFVARGEFGLASGQKPDGSYERVWFQESVDPEDVAFEAGVFLLTKAKAQALKAGPAMVAAPAPAPQPQPIPSPSPATSEFEQSPERVAALGDQTATIRLTGAVPPELWNRLGTRLLPKLRAGSNLRVAVDFSVTVDRHIATTLKLDLRQILDDLGLTGKVQIHEADGAPSPSSESGSLF
jgi:hypothetical protein